jgi:hypothetical protein
MLILYANEYKNISSSDLWMEENKRMPSFNEIINSCKQIITILLNEN